MKTDIPIFFYNIFFFKSATAYIYVIFAAKKSKIAKNVFDKKASTIDKSIATTSVF